MEVHGAPGWKTLGLSSQLSQSACVTACVRQGAQAAHPGASPAPRPSLRPPKPLCTAQHSTIQHSKKTKHQSKDSKLERPFTLLLLRLPHRRPAPPLHMQTGHPPRGRVCPSPDGTEVLGSAATPQPRVTSHHPAPESPGTPCSRNFWHSNWSHSGGQAVGCTPCPLVPWDSFSPRHGTNSQGTWPSWLQDLGQSQGLGGCGPSRSHQISPQCFICLPCLQPLYPSLEASARA